MPLRMRTWLDEFAWLTDPEGNPYAPVYALGAAEKPIHYMQCPICSCIHELRHDQRPSGIHEPHCLLIQFVTSGGPQATQWRGVLDAWRAKYPDAAKHQRVHLVPVDQVPRALPKAKAKARRVSKRKAA